VYGRIAVYPLKLRIFKKTHSYLRFENADFCFFKSQYFKNAISNDPLSVIRFKIILLYTNRKRNARASSGVLLMFSWNGIDVIKKLHLCPFVWYSCNFLIKKITSIPFQENTRRCSSIPQIAMSSTP
jgi:hypothetical protein